MKYTPFSLRYFQRIHWRTKLQDHFLKFQSIAKLGVTHWPTVKVLCPFGPGLQESCPPPHRKTYFAL